MWLDHKDFGKVFEVWGKGQAVHGWEGYKFLTRLHRIKGSVRSQNMSAFGDLRLKDAATLTRIKYLEAIESSPMWTTSLSEERKSLKEELNNILFIQERAAWM
ncbi:hypothetical protein TorRG33x02_291100, partial [Trema orientale]